MKYFLIFISYNILFLLSSCQKEVNVITKPEVVLADFDYIEQNGKVIFLNKCAKSVVRYELRVDTTLFFSGAIKDTLGIINLSNGNYHIALEVTNDKAIKDSIFKDIVINDVLIPKDTSNIIDNLSFPHLKFSYELLDSGFVQFHNLSTSFPQSLPFRGL